MRGILAILLLILPLGAQAQEAGRDEVIRAINQRNEQAFPHALYNFTLPSSDSFNAFVKGTALRYLTHADEPFLCLKAEGASACMNCEFDCRRGVEAIDPVLGECRPEYEPVCVSSEEGREAYGYQVSAASDTAAGFISAAVPVLDNTGAGEWKEYFFRYWRYGGAVRKPDGSAKNGGAWSPSLPKICHSGYRGLASASPESAAVQFATGALKERRFDAANAINAYQYLGGLGTSRRDLYRIRARYVVPSTGKTGYGAPLIYWWSRSSAGGQRCLVPHFLPRRYEGDVNAMRLLKGQGELGPAPRYEPLPCGLLDTTTRESFGNFEWNAPFLRWECRAGTARVDGEDKLELYLDFPNGGGYKTEMVLRKCYRCE